MPVVDPELLAVCDIDVEPVDVSDCVPELEPVIDTVVVPVLLADSEPVLLPVTDNVDETVLIIVLVALLVAVVDGDVTSQPKNVSVSCWLIKAHIASARICASVESAPRISKLPLKHTTV